MEEPIQFRWQEDLVLGVYHRTVSPHVPGVIFVHGLGGSRVDVRRLFVRLARRLHSVDIASLRVDLYASGVSDGAFHMMTYAAQLSQLCHVIDEVRRQALWQGPIILFGGSQGGRLALAAARRSPEIAGVCLWSGIFAAEEDLNASASHRARAKPHKIGSAIVFETPWGVWCNRLMYTDFLNMTITDENDLPSVPLLGVYGSEDPTTQASRLLLQRARRDVVVVAGADHLLSQYEWEMTLMESVENWLQDRFVKNYNYSNSLT